MHVAIKVQRHHNTNYNNDVQAVIYKQQCQKTITTINNIMPCIIHSWSAATSQGWAHDWLTGWLAGHLRSQKQLVLCRVLCSVAITGGCSDGAVQKCSCTNWFFSYVAGRVKNVCNFFFFNCLLFPLDVSAVVNEVLSDEVRPG